MWDVCETCVIWGRIVSGLGVCITAGVIMPLVIHHLEVEIEEVKSAGLALGDLPAVLDMCSRESGGVNNSSQSQS